MHFDDRTFLLSASITLAILAIVLLSMRQSIYQTVQGLGFFATANLLVTMGTFLVGLRGVIPFPVSFYGGNIALMSTGLFYIAAIRSFDGNPPPRFFIPVGTAACAAALVAAQSSGAPGLPIALVNGFLGLGAIFAAWSLMSKSTRSFNRLFCALGFSGYAIAALARACSVLAASEAGASLFARDANSSTLYLAISVMTAIFTLGFILLANERTHDRLLYLATHDPLTGARTRGSFMEMARAELAASAGGRKQMAILIADLDHFKRINDSFGHQTGDKALRNFVRAANDAIRKSDVLARYGGEEFVVLLPDTGMDAALEVAERLRAATQLSVAPAELGGSPVTVSIGVASAHRGASDLEDLIASADVALYESKAQGRNRVTLAGPSDAPAQASLKTS